MEKSSPAFWWDFDSEGDVIIQNDYPRGECLAILPNEAAQVDSDATDRIS